MCCLTTSMHCQCTLWKQFTFSSQRWAFDVCFYIQHTGPFRDQEPVFTPGITLPLQWSVTKTINHPLQKSSCCRLHWAILRRLGDSMVCSSFRGVCPCEESVDSDGTCKQNRGEAMWALHSHGSQDQWIRLIPAHEGCCSTAFPDRRWWIRPLSGPMSAQETQWWGRRGGRSGQPNPRISNMLTRDYPNRCVATGAKVLPASRGRVCRYWVVMRETLNWWCARALWEQCSLTFLWVRKQQVCKDTYWLWTFSGRRISNTCTEVL